jgi:hypothetical protein
MDEFGAEILEYFNKNLYDHTKKQVLEFNVDELKEKLKSPSNENEAINIFALEFEKLVEILNKNEKLQTDYFKYKFYSKLSEEDFISFISLFKCPFSYLNILMEHILEHEFTIRKLENFIISTCEIFSEKEIIILIKFILSKPKDELKFQKNQSKSFDNFPIHNEKIYLISLLISNGKLDKQYTLSLMKRDVNLQFTSKELIDLFYILSNIFYNINTMLNVKPNSNRNNSFENIIAYISLISDLFLIYFLQNKISRKVFEDIKPDLDALQKEIKDFNISNISALNLLSGENLQLLNQGALSKFDDLIIENLKIF